VETNSVEVDIFYNEIEIKKAISFYILHIRDIKTFAIVVYSVIFVAVVLSLFFSVWLSLLYFFAGLLLHYIYYQRPIKAYLKFYQKRKGAHYSLMDDKISVVGEEIKSEYTWTVFKKAFETPSAFLLLDDNKFIYVFPKTCFSELLEIEKAHNLMIAKFSDFKEYRASRKYAHRGKR
jgi:hypothetical protein